MWKHQNVETSKCKQVLTLVSLVSSWHYRQ